MIFFLVKLTGVTSCLLKSSNNFSNVNCKVSNLKNKIAANLILVTSPNWINCPFSRTSRKSFCQNCSKICKSGDCKCFFIFKTSETVARHMYDQSISQFLFLLRFCFLTCISLTNDLISKLQLPYSGVISAIVYYLTRFLEFNFVPLVPKRPARATLCK
mgnify:CR=1 FL=1